MLKKRYIKNEPTITGLKDLLSGQIRIVYFLPVFTDRFRVVCRKYSSCQRFWWYLVNGIKFWCVLRIIRRFFSITATTWSTRTLEWCQTI